MDTISALRNDLSHHLLDAPWDPNSYTSAHMDIRAVATIVADWEGAHASVTAVRSRLRAVAPGFDFDQWALPYVEDGTYHPDMFMEE